MVNFEAQVSAKQIDERTREIVKEICAKNGAEPVYSSYVAIASEEINYIPDDNHNRYLRGHCKLVIEIDLN